MESPLCQVIFLSSLSTNSFIYSTNMYWTPATYRPLLEVLEKQGWTKQAKIDHGEPRLTWRPQPPICPSVFHGHPTDPGFQGSGVDSWHCVGSPGSWQAIPRHLLHLLRCEPKPKSDYNSLQHLLKESCFHCTWAQNGKLERVLRYSQVNFHISFGVYSYNTRHLLISYRKVGTALLLK